MPQLLSLECSEQPALLGVHQAHDQVDLLVEGLFGMVGQASTDRANTVVGVKSGFHRITLFPEQSSFFIIHNAPMHEFSYQTPGIKRQRT